MPWDHKYVPKSSAKKGCIPQSLPERVFPQQQRSRGCEQQPKDSTGPRTVGSTWLAEAVRKARAAAVVKHWFIVAAFRGSALVVPPILPSFFVIGELDFICLTLCRKLTSKLWIWEAFYTPTVVCVGKDDLALQF